MKTYLKRLMAVNSFPSRLNDENQRFANLIPPIRWL